MKKFCKQWYRNVKTGGLISFFGTLDTGAKVLGAGNLVFVEI